jgi:hypothetical protein
VRFDDWRERAVHVVFSGAVAFRWDIEDAKADYRDDESYRVHNSAWLERCRLQGLASDEHHHFKLCFNPYGELDVLAMSFRLNE